MVFQYNILNSQVHPFSMLLSHWLFTPALGSEFGFPMGYQATTAPLSFCTRHVGSHIRPDSSCLHFLVNVPLFLKIVYPMNCENCVRWDVLGRGGEGERGGFFLDGDWWRCCVFKFCFPFRFFFFFFLWVFFLFWYEPEGYGWGWGWMTRVKESYAFVAELLYSTYIHLPIPNPCLGYDPHLTSSTLYPYLYTPGSPLKPVSQTEPKKKSI